MNLSTLYKKLTNGKYLIGLLIGFVGIINFCSAGSYTYSGIITPNTGIPNMVVPQTTPSTDVSISCIFQILTSDGTANLRFTPNFSYFYGNNYGGNYTQLNGLNIWGGDPVTFDYDFSEYTGYPSWASPYYGPYIVYYKNFYLNDGLTANYTCTFEGPYIIDNPGGGSCPEIDTNYCVENGLCPNECGTGEIYTGDTQRSALYINNIQKPGGPLINITIPEEIEREDYYDTGESNIDIIGYGYDQEKMQQMVNTQYYKPTAEEMNGLIEKIADFLPLVAVALLIARIRRVVKKVFKF